MLGDFSDGSASKESACNAEETMWVQSLGWENLLGEEMETHSSILAWEIPWTEKPSRLQSRGHKESDTIEWLTLHYLKQPEKEEQHKIKKKS